MIKASSFEQLLGCCAGGLNRNQPASSIPFKRLPCWMAPGVLEKPIGQQAQTTWQDASLPSRAHGRSPARAFRPGWPAGRNCGDVGAASAVWRPSCSIQPPAWASWLSSRSGPDRSSWRRRAPAQWPAAISTPVPTVAVRIRASRPEAPGKQTAAGRGAALTAEGQTSAFASL